MIQTIQKVIKVGSSGGITIPAKEMKRQNISFGDNVEVFIRPVRKTVNKEDQHIIDAAKKVLEDYRQDFKNLANR